MNENYPERIEELIAVGKNMKLKRPLPPGRSIEQLRNHYLVEKAIADKLKGATFNERKIIYASMYDDLFSKVPDHVRLTIRNDNRLTSIGIRNKLSLINTHIDKTKIFLEFAPGDCKFAIEVAKRVKFAYAVDISDQRSDIKEVPTNFILIIYDGYNLNEVEENSIDIVFSDQLIEHFHPEETILHFRLVYRILKKGGQYVFRTPNANSGPHDISMYFSDRPEGFHIKEWTYREIEKIRKELGYLRINSYWHVRGITIKLPNVYFFGIEKMLNLLPNGSIKRIITRYFIPSICCAFVK